MIVFLTGGTVVQPCVNSNWLSQWAGPIFDRHKIDVFKPISKKFVTCDDVHDFYCCAKFGGNQIRPHYGGFWENRWNITFFINTPFLSNSSTVRPLTTFSCLIAQMMQTHARVCFFVAYSGNQIVQKNNFGGMNRRFLAKYAKYWNVHIIKITASIKTKFFRVIETPNYSLGGPNMPPNKSKMADGRHLEKLKNLHIFTTDWPILTKFDTVN